jgi:hypothetical protein
MFDDLLWPGFVWPGEKTHRPAIKYSTPRGPIKIEGRWRLTEPYVREENSSMKKFCLAVFLVVPVMTFVALAGEEGSQAEGKVSNRTVIVPQDTSPFKVQMNQRVRITGEGIAGSTLVADVVGPAKIVAENSILTMKRGHLLIGMAKVEYEIKPTGQGVVKVKIRSTPPQPNAEPHVTTYEFDVR